MEYSNIVAYSNCHILRCHVHTRKRELMTPDNSRTQESIIVDPIMEDPKKNPITEDPEQDPIPKDTEENPATEDAK